MVDYSKWKNIEISDDEDDTHPNIDTPSLFRWRHQARIERMEELETEKDELDRKRQSYKARLMEAKERLEIFKDQKHEREIIMLEIADLEKEGKELDRRGEALNLKMHKTPWNVDTISKPGFQKTILNKQAVRKDDDDSSLTEAEREQQLKDFVRDNEKLCKQYGMYRKYEDSLHFLQKHSNLVNEHTANYLVIWAINLEMEEKHELVTHVAHQCICLQYILELGKQLDVDPRSCVASFFAKIHSCSPEYRTQFQNEIDGFIERIRKRAQEKIAEAVREVEEEERIARIGPGGLDPADVFDELPEAMQKCFQSRDIALLHKTIAEMPLEQAKYHMKRCIDSGLWVPNAADANNPLFNGQDDDDDDDDEDDDDERDVDDKAKQKKKEEEKEKEPTKSEEKEEIYAGVS